MKRRILGSGCTACALVLAAATPAFAGDPQIELQQSVYAYTHGTADARPNGGSPNRSTDDSTTTMPPDLEIAMRKDHWEFSVFPTEPGGASFEALNEFIPHLSVGFDFGDQRSSHSGVDGKTSSETIEAGPMAEWDPLYGDHEVELTLTLNYEQATSKSSANAGVLALTTNNGQLGETDARGFESEFQAMYVQRVTDNLKVAAGGIYTYGGSYDRARNTRNVTNEVELIPLQLRAGIY